MNGSTPWWVTEQGEWRSGQPPDGWWQASDSHWYPPSATQTPSSSPTPPSSLPSSSPAYGSTSPFGGSSETVPPGVTASGQHQAAGAPSPAKPSIARRLRFALLLVVAFAGGAAVGASSGDDDDLEAELAAAEQERDDLRGELESAGDVEAQTLTDTTTTAPPPTTEPPETTTTTEAPPPTTEPENTFGDGTHQVGSDIAPGTYQAPGGDFCYWERLSGLSGEFDDVITNDFAPGGQVVVEVFEADVAFSTSECGEWAPVD